MYHLYTAQIPTNRTGLDFMLALDPEIPAGFKDSAEDLGGVDFPLRFYGFNNQIQMSSFRSKICKIMVQQH